MISGTKNLMCTTTSFMDQFIHGTTAEGTKWLGITGTRATADLLLYDLKVTLPNKIASRFEGIPALD